MTGFCVAYHTMSDTAKGILISFDGLDSSGKQTQASVLADKLRHLGHVVHTYQTPDYSTPSGQELKARLQGTMGDWQQTPWQEKLDYFARNRAEHREAVQSALARGELVVYDRYIPSSLAFMAIEAQFENAATPREAVHQTVRDIEYQKNNMPQEAISFFLDMPPRTAEKLLNKRKALKQEKDEYTDHLEVQQKLYHEYEFLTAKDPTRYVRIPCVANDRLRSIEDIAYTVWQELTSRYPNVVTEKQGV